MGTSTGVFKTDMIRTMNTLYEYLYFHTDCGYKSSESSLLNCHHACTQGVVSFKVDLESVCMQKVMKRAEVLPTLLIC
jgi:hypothetical protein